MLDAVNYKFTSEAAFSIQIFCIYTLVTSCIAPDNKDERLTVEPVAKDYKNGTEIRFKCKTGFVVSGISEYICLYGDWVPFGIPTCEGK